MIEIFAGSTSHSVYVALVDSTTGLPKSGIAYTDVTASYARTRSARTAITAASLASATAAYGSGGWAEEDATNQPGLYRLDVPDAAYAAGAEEVVVTVKATGCRTEHAKFVLTVWNKQVGSIPNAAAGASGGLQLATPLRTGTAVTGSTSTMMLESDASTVNGFYVPCLITITGGTGAGQSRSAGTYTGSSKILNLAGNQTWATSPDSTSTYRLDPAGQTIVATNNDKSGYGLSSGQIFNNMGQTSFLPMKGGTVAAGSTASAVIVATLPAGSSYVGQHLYHAPSGEVRLIASQSFDAGSGNYTFNFTGSAGTTAGPFSAVSTSDVVCPSA